METKNTIILNYSCALNDACESIVRTSSSFNDNPDENIARIKTLNVLLESVRSQTVLLQQAIDAYPK